LSYPQKCPARYSELTFLWTVVNYALVPDPVQEANRSSADRPTVASLWIVLLAFRSVIAGLVTVVIAGVRPGSLLLGLFLAMGSLLLPIARRWRVSPVYGAELEIGATALPLIVIAVWVVDGRLTALRHWIPVPFSESRTSALYFIAAIVIFNLRGGTYIVRGILNKCGALPELDVPKDTTVTTRPPRVVTEKIVDAVEINRGRWIGNLERILTLAMVADHSYAAIAFLMAAKGFIRSRDLENRDWAEYFLLGTLASIAISLVGGILIWQIIQTFW